MPPETFSCPICGLKYPSRELAEHCEEWCRTHPSCNIEIIKYALQDEEAGT